MGEGAGGRVGGIDPLGHPVMGQPISPAWVVALKDLPVVVAFLGLGSIEGKPLGCRGHHCVIDL